MKQLPRSLVLIAILFSTAVFSQVKSLAEKLGHPKNARLLILHADDVGVAHAEDSATFVAFRNGGVNSASIMVPCPWFPEVAAFANRHSEFDWGIHTTFTAEWKYYKWDGVLPASEIPSLVDKNGYLYPSVEEFAKHAKVEEVEKEMRAQIEKALAAGIPLTHLDNHMGSLFASPEMIKSYQKVGREYKLPVLLPANMIRMMAPSLMQVIDTNAVVMVDNFVSAHDGIKPGQWKEFYDGAVRQLKPGLNEMIFHLAYDSDEMKAVTVDHPDFGSAWRQRDLDYVTSNDFKNLLKKEGIILVTWGDIQRVMYK